MGTDLLGLVGLVYCSLFVMLSVRKVLDPECSFYSPAPPFAFGGTYTARENRLTDFDRFKLFLTNYVLILGSVAVGLSGMVVGLISLPTWLTWGTGLASAVTTIILVWLAGWFFAASRMVKVVWRRLYTPIDVEAEQALARAVERQEERAALKAHYKAEQQLAAKHREQEQRRFEGRTQLETLGLAAVLNEPESPMSRFYVTKTFTEYGDPLAPFRKKFAPLTEVNLRELLEQSGVVQYDPAKTIDVEPSLATDEAEPEQDLLELSLPETTAQPKRRLEALSKVREQAVASPVEDAGPLDLPRVEGHIAEHIWDKLRTDWRDVIDSPVAKAQGSVTPARGRYVPEQLVLAETLLEATLGGRPARLKGWRYRGKSVPGMLLLDLQTAESYPELYAWLQKPENRDRLLDLETARDDLEAFSLDISVDDVEYGEGPVGGWRPPTLALTEKAWIIAIGYVPTGEATTSRGVKEPLWKIDLPIEW